MTDVEILLAAAEIVSRRGAGVPTDIMADSLRSFAKSQQWMEDNNISEETKVYLAWDGDIIKALIG